MGILNIFGLGSNKPDVVGRRAFLRGVLAAAPAAVAAAAAIDLAFVPELQAAVRDELKKIDEMVEGDLGLTQGRIMVAAPKQIFDPNVRVWRSVAAEAGAWADYVSKATGVRRPLVLAATTRLAQLVDFDLRDNQIAADSKIDVTLPKIVRTWTDIWGEKRCEIGLGLHKETLFDGTEQFTVKFKDVAPRLVDAKGKVFKMADQPDGAVDVTARLKAAPANAGWHPPEAWEDAEDDDLDQEEAA